MNCTKELIREHGVERVNMENIAAMAELSKATVYLYFSSKEDLLNEICEEAGRKFHEYLKSFNEAGLNGMAALKYIWRGYIELFGSSNEMIIVFQVRNYLNSWLPIVSMEGKHQSPYIDKILMTVKELIEGCKAEGVFAPDLDTDVATRLLLSLFSIIVEHASKLPAGVRAAPAVIDEMTNTFQIIVRGFAREGIEHSLLDIRTI